MNVQNYRYIKSRWYDIESLLAQNVPGDEPSNSPTTVTFNFISLGLPNLIWLNSGEFLRILLSKGDNIHKSRHSNENAHIGCPISCH